MRDQILLPTWILIAGWMLSLWGYQTLETNRTVYDAARVDRMMGRFEESLDDSVTLYENALRGGAGYWVAARDADWNGWRSYVHAIDIRNRFAGTLGLAIVAPVDEARLTAFLAAQRKYVPGFTLRLPANTPPPPQPRKDRFVVVAAEPSEPGQPPPVMGLDMGADPIRRAAAERARDTGEATISQSVKLTGLPGSPPGFVLFQPVYDPAKPTRTVEERRLALRAWVLVGIEAGAFFNKLISPWRDQTELVAWDSPDGRGTVTFAHAAESRTLTAFGVPASSATHTVPRVVTTPRCSAANAS